MEFNPNAVNPGVKKGGMMKIIGTMAIQVMITDFHFLGFLGSIDFDYMQCCEYTVFKKVIPRSNPGITFLT